LQLGRVECRGENWHASQGVKEGAAYIDGVELVSGRAHQEEHRVKTVHRLVGGIE
jgi:hypothetical protein